jgi:vitellogenic carboxypeptidase-like protein
VANTLTESFLEALHLPGFDKTQRHIWKPGGDELAGYYKTFRNFTRLTVRNAGHILPYDQPLWGYQMINFFTQGFFSQNKKEILKTFVEKEIPHNKFVKI